MTKPRDTDIPIRFLRECFDYRPRTGELWWRIRPRKHFDTAGAHASWNTQYAGDLAGSLNGHGYVRVKFTIQGRVRRVTAHRVVVALLTGAWPTDRIDHRNGHRSDNRERNLRDASDNENQHNRIALGATWHTHRQKWQAQITVYSQNIHLGYFDTPLVAHKRYLKAKRQMHTFQPIPRAAR